MNNDYHPFPKKTPPRDDVYLVSVTNNLALRAGVAGHAILIARYNVVKREWHAMLGIDPISIFNIVADVVAWRELPRP